MSATFLTTVSGRQVDLFAPTAADIDFADIAEQLAKEARFNGATPGALYVVAQHLGVGAKAILDGAMPGLPLTLAEDERRLVAAYFLLHDFPEAYLKDDTTPKKRALDLVAAEFGIAAPIVFRAFAQLTERFDAAIHEAAGLAWPPPAWIASMVKHADRVMLVTEWRDLRPGHALPAGYEDVPALDWRIAAWDWEAAKYTLLVMARELLPKV